MSKRGFWKLSGGLPSCPCLCIHCAPSAPPDQGKRKGLCLEAWRPYGWASGYTQAMCAGGGSLRSGAPAPSWYPTEPCSKTSFQSHASFEKAQARFKKQQWDRERQISYDITYMWNLKKMRQMNLFTDQKETHRHRKQTYGYQRGK